MGFNRRGGRIRNGGRREQGPQSGGKPRANWIRRSMYQPRQGDSGEREIRGRDRERGGDLPDSRRRILKIYNLNPEITNRELYVCNIEDNTIKNSRNAIYKAFS